MATKWQSFLSEEGFDKLKEANKLNEEDSKEDPDEEPYRSKYKAQEILTEVRDSLKRFSETSEEDQELKFVSSAIDVILGQIYIDTEELSTGEECLTKCLDVLEKFKLHKDASNIYHVVLNNLGILWTGRRNNTKALSFLMRAEEIYKEYKELVDDSPKSFEEYIVPLTEDNQEKLEHSRSEYFEKTYTLTLYYIAQVYAKEEEREKASSYCRITLQRQLDAHSYDPADWALNAATLSQYYIQVDDFRQARHCLASAELIYQEIELKEEMDEVEAEEAKEKLQQGKADIQRCWAKYCIALLESSRDKLMDEMNDPLANRIEDTEEQKYATFNLELTSHEDQVACKYVLVFDEAREVFLKGQAWLRMAKEFYVFEGRCSDYVQIIQDHSSLFKALAFFEMDFERQLKMQKKRIDMLLPIAKELSPQHYLLVVRQILFELAETYSLMMDIRLSLVESDPANRNMHNIKRINLHAQHSIDQYQAYLDTLKDSKTKDYPEEFSDMDERPALLAFFCMGRLHSKFLVPEVTRRIENVKKTKECYDYILQYCDKHTDAVERSRLRTEVDVCREMVSLLPLKMEKIRQSAE